MNDSVRRRSFIFAGGFLILIAISTVGAYFHFVNGGFSSRPDDWGAFGSLVGGAAGSAIAASALLALVYGLIVQHRELDALKKQFYSQAFRDRLNKLKSNYLDSLSSAYLIVNKISGSEKSESLYTGNHAMFEIVSNALRTFQSSDPENETLGELNARIGKFRNHYEEQISHIWTQMIHIANCIDQHPVEIDRIAESDALKRQLSMNERVMLLLFVPIFGSKSDLAIIEKMQLLEALPTRILDRLPHSLIRAHNMVPLQKT